MKHKCASEELRMKWRSIKVANPIVERIERIAPCLGYSGISQFVAEAIQRHLMSRERKFDEIELERSVGRKVLGKDE